MKFIWAVGILLGVLVPATSADDFENTVRGIRKLTNANATETASIRTMLVIQRQFMAKAIRFDMLRDGASTSEAKIDALLDKWQRAYLRAVPDLAFQTHVDFYRETFSLEELKELEELLAKPVFQKFVDPGMNANRLFPQLMERVQKRSAEILDALIAEDPDWWRLDDAEAANMPDAIQISGKVENRGPLAEAWRYLFATVLDQNDYGWSVFDIAMAEQATKYGAQCGVGADLDEVLSLIPAMKQENMDEFEELAADTSPVVVLLDTAQGEEVKTSMRALVHTAILAGQDWASTALASEIADAQNRPDCPKVRGWTLNVLRKHDYLKSLDE